MRQSKEQIGEPWVEVAPDVTAQPQLFRPGQGESECSACRMPFSFDASFCPACGTKRTERRQRGR